MLKSKILYYTILYNTLYYSFYSYYIHTVVMTMMKGFCTSSSSSSCRCERRQRRQSETTEERVLKGMTHEERLQLISKYKFFAYGSICLGSIVLISLISVAVFQFRWGYQFDSTSSVIVHSVVFGMGIGPSLVLIFAESCRFFGYVTKVQTIDEELMETATVSIEEDDDDDDDDDNNNNNNNNIDNIDIENHNMENEIREDQV